MYIYNRVNTTMEVIIIQFKEAKENSSDILNAPQASWKCAENMYYMNVQLSHLSLNLFLLGQTCQPIDPKKYLLK